MNDEDLRARLDQQHKDAEEAATDRKRTGEMVEHLHRWLFKPPITGGLSRAEQLDRMMESRRFLAALTRFFAWATPISVALAGLIFSIVRGKG